jgi:hypothetical protein
LLRILVSYIYRFSGELFGMGSNHTKFSNKKNYNFQQSGITSSNSRFDLSAMSNNYNGYQTNTYANYDSSDLQQAALE